MTIEIKLFSGEMALIDDEDHPLILKFKKWYLNRSGKKRYANAYIPKVDYSIILMHRLIMKAKDGEYIDHINGNGLDNRKKNLRFCTQAQNIINSRKRKGCTSKYKGVDYMKSRNKWRARIAVNKIRIKLGEFKNEADAAMAYDNAALKYYGKFAKLNISYVS